MVIPVSFLRDFAVHAAKVKNTVLYPALACWRLGFTGTHVHLTKSNMNMFVQKVEESDQEPETMLLDERKMLGLLAAAKTSEVTIFKKGATIIARSGEKEVEFTPEDIKIFPQFPKRDSETFVQVDENMNQALRASLAYVSDSKNITRLNYVHLNGEIFASNNSYVFTRKLVQGSSALLDLDTAEVVSSSPGVFSIGGSYMFFNKPDGVNYAFIKSEFSTFDYSPIISKQPDEEVFVEISRQELIDFCGLVNTTSKSDNPTATVSPGNLKHEDANFNDRVEEKITTTGSYPINFKFATRTMLKAMAALPYEKLKLWPMAPHLIVTTDEDVNYKGIITRLN